MKNPFDSFPAAVAAALVLTCAGPLRATETASTPVAERVQESVKTGAAATKRGVSKAVDATERGVSKAVDATERGLGKAADATGRGLERAGKAVGNTADKAKSTLSKKKVSAADDKSVKQDEPAKPAASK